MCIATPLATAPVAFDTYTRTHYRTRNQRRAKSKQKR